MCGIVGYIGQNDPVNALMDGLRSLEYRGYDSAGIALGPTMGVLRRAGELDELQAAVETDRPTGTFGIGHTRWSTHGPPTDRNAHPHTDEAGRVAVVHNGIIENYSQLKADLEANGVTFSSETDTEVVPHLIAQALARGEDPETAFHTTVDQLEGSYAIAAIVEGEETIYAARQGSPLVLGVDDEVPFSPATSQPLSNTHAMLCFSKTAIGLFPHRVGIRSLTKTANPSRSPSRRFRIQPMRPEKVGMTTTCSRKFTNNPPRFASRFLGG